MFFHFEFDRWIFIENGIKEIDIQGLARKINSGRIDIGKFHYFLRPKYEHL